jgi:predicted metal-dependent phosphoesterase TrpH
MRQQHSFDLHLHTEWSWDGTATLSSYLATADARKMRCLAITDHLCWDVADEIAEQAAAYPDLRVITGSELYVQSEVVDDCVHFLCYGFPAELPPALEPIHAYGRNWLQSGGEPLRQSIARHFGLSEDESRRIAMSPRSPKTHPVQGLTLSNQTLTGLSLRAAGLEFSDDELPDILADTWAPVPEARPASEVIPQLKQTDLVLVLAHPHYCFDGENTDTLDALREELQFDGIECAHRRISREHTEALAQYCAERGLLATAGSDNHYEDRIEECLGITYGCEDWLDPFMERVPTL